MGDMHVMNTPSFDTTSGSCFCFRLFSWEDGTPVQYSTIKSSSENRLHGFWSYKDLLMEILSKGLGLDLVVFTTILMAGSILRMDPIKLGRRLFRK